MKRLLGTPRRSFGPSMMSSNTLYKMRDKRWFIERYLNVWGNMRYKRHLSFCFTPSKEDLVQSGGAKGGTGQRGRVRDKEILYEGCTAMDMHVSYIGYRRSSATLYHAVSITFSLGPTALEQRGQAKATCGGGANSERIPCFRFTSLLSSGSRYSRILCRLKLRSFAKFARR